MSAPTRWRDKLGRVWVQSDTLGAFYCRDINYGHQRSVIEAICGPLEPIEPMARVRTSAALYASELYSTTVHAGYSRDKASTYSLARAEEIAQAFRTLGYTDATVETIND